MDSKYILIIHFGSFASADQQNKTSAQEYSQNKLPIHLSFSLLCIQQNRYFVWPPLFSRCSVPSADQASGLQVAGSSVWCLRVTPRPQRPSLSWCLMSLRVTPRPPESRVTITALHSLLTHKFESVLILKRRGREDGASPRPALPAHNSVASGVVSISGIIVQT